MEYTIEFQLVIMSATLETDALSEYFFDAPAFMVQGRTYPVEVFIHEFYMNLPIKLVKDELKCLKKHSCLELFERAGANIIYESAMSVRSNF